MTTAAKRARKKANRKAKPERLAELLESADALADEDLADTERPESEKAAAMMALAAARRFGKKLKTSD